MEHLEAETKIPCRMGTYVVEEHFANRNTSRTKAHLYPKPVAISRGAAESLFDDLELKPPAVAPSKPAAGAVSTSAPPMAKPVSV